MEVYDFLCFVSVIMAVYVKTISFGKDVHIELCTPNESKLRFYLVSYYIYSQI